VSAKPSLLAWQIAWFNESTWLERIWRRSWWEYLADKSTLTDADGGDAMFKSGSICAGNEAMHRHLLQLLRAA
jgi:hypothetical protein